MASKKEIAKNKAIVKAYLSECSLTDSESLMEETNLEVGDLFSSNTILDFVEYKMDDSRTIKERLEFLIGNLFDLEEAEEALKQIRKERFI